MKTDQQEAAEKAEELKPVAAPRESAADSFKVGDEVHMTIKGVTNNRIYRAAGEILRIEGRYAKVRYKQPWTTMRDALVDLRDCKKINRRTSAPSASSCKNNFGRS